MLPGVEVSFAYPKYGLHVLAIFHADEDLSSVNSFLRGQQDDPSAPLLEADGRHRDIESSDSPVVILRRLRKRFGCLLIPCHPGGDSGFMRSFEPGDAVAFLSDLAPDAVEHLSRRDLGRLRSADGDVGRLAIVNFSDAHSIDEIGGKAGPGGTPRATYLKLSATDLDALRLALHDPETRLVRGSVPAAVHPRITSMTVKGSGFLGTMTVNWNDDLNVIIGGRGVGKSAVIETLRYALDMDPVFDEDYRRNLAHHALGSGGEVEVVLERPVGRASVRRYRVTRVRGEEPRVTEADTGEELPLPPADLLGPEGSPIILGQREVYAVSSSEEYRLALLDELIGEEAEVRARAVRDVVERLRSNARAISDAETKLSKREEYRQSLKSVEHEIDVYERHGAASKLQEAARLRNDGQILRDAAEALHDGRREWETVARNVVAPLERALRGLSRGQSRHRVFLDEAAQVLETLRSDLDTLLAQGKDLFEAAEAKLSGLMQRWREALAPLEDEINRIKREAQTEALDPDRLLDLSEKRSALVSLIEEFDRHEVRLDALLAERRELLGQLRERRLAEHRLRRERADEISDLFAGRLRLRVVFKGQKEEYKRMLSGLFKGSGVSRNALECLAAPEAADGLMLSEAVEEGPDEVMERFNLTPAYARKVVDWLTSHKRRLYDLQAMVPPDAVSVELKVGETYRPLDELSVGQRATAVLLLLFALQGRVLVLDQPEDDLDNQFVYEDIVKILREQKGIRDPTRRRQIIAATHNPNIPVIGDAELVLALEVRDGRASVVGRASIDDARVRQIIKDVMEGGEDAFRRRAEKYGGVPL